VIFDFYYDGGIWYNGMHIFTIVVL